MVVEDIRPSRGQNYKFIQNFIFKRYGPTFIYVSPLIHKLVGLRAYCVYFVKLGCRFRIIVLQLNWRWFQSSRLTKERVAVVLNLEDEVEFRLLFECININAFVDVCIGYKSSYPY